MFALSKICTKTFFSINASKHNAFCVFAKKIPCGGMNHGIVARQHNQCEGEALI
jgi:hypothetical protein